MRKLFLSQSLKIKDFGAHFILCGQTLEFVSPTAMNSPVKFSAEMSWGFSEKSFYLNQPTKKPQQKDNNKTKPNQKQQKKN